LQAIPLPLRISSLYSALSIKAPPSAFIACKHAPTSIKAGPSSGAFDQNHCQPNYTDSFISKA